MGKVPRVLGFEPQVQLEAGLQELAEWLLGAAAVDHLGRAQQELLSRGLAI